MKVKELINLLSKENQDADVIIKEEWRGFYQCFLPFGSHYDEDGNNLILLANNLKNSVFDKDYVTLKIAVVNDDGVKANIGEKMKILSVNQKYGWIRVKSLFSDSIFHIGPQDIILDD